MHSSQRSLVAVAVAACLVPAGAVWAASPYVEGAVYVAGDRVCQSGDLFRAKWWAGPDDRPWDVDSVAQPWETPWERILPAAAECGAQPPENRAPTVDATATPAPLDPSGATPIALYAEASDADGDALTFAWEQVQTSAPSVSIQGAQGPQASVLLPEAVQSLTYRFRVVVSDGARQVSDEVEVVLTPIAGNRAPSAVAGATPTELVGAGSVRLSALGSSDPDGDPLSYQWVQVSPNAPLASIDDPSDPEPLASLPEPGSDTGFVFEVRVSDGTLYSSARAGLTQRIDLGPVACPTWDPSEIYTEGDLVAQGGQIWRAGWWTQGDVPGTTGEWGVWRLSAAGCTGGGSPNPDPDPDPDPTPDPTPDPDPGEPTVVRLSDLLTTEAALTSGPLMAQVKASIATRDNAQVEAIAPGRAANPANVKRVEREVSESDWDYVFPRRAPEYGYVNFLKAVGKFPALCGDYGDGRDSDAICRKSLATMFAHFTQETGGHTIAWPEPQWRQGLVYVRELGWSEAMANGYGLCDPGTWQGQTWPCSTFPAGHPSAGQFKSYFGRGAKQLSYNYNYGPFSEAMFGDVTTLLDRPNLVADTWLNLASAVFFYVYPQPPKPSMLHALDGTWVPNAQDLANGLEPGFGVTTQIINGGIECGGSAEHIQSQNRIDYYRSFATFLGVPVPADEVLGCAGMKQFDTAGAGALPIYWEQGWSGAPSCQLVGYQTPFSALKEGDYVRCVEHYFDVIVDYGS